MSAYDATLTEVWEWSSAVTQSPRAPGKLALDARGLALGSPWLHMSASAGGSPNPAARLRRGERDLQDEGGHRCTGRPKG